MCVLVKLTTNDTNFYASYAYIPISLHIMVSLTYFLHPLAYLIYRKKVSKNTENRLKYLYIVLFPQKNSIILRNSFFLARTYFFYSRLKQKSIPISRDAYFFAYLDWCETRQGVQRASRQPTQGDYAT